MADGRSQRGYIPKKDAASPTSELESVVLISVIDAKEGRDVGIGDIQGDIPPRRQQQRHMDVANKNTSRIHGKSGPGNIFAICNHRKR